MLYQIQITTQIVCSETAGHKDLPIATTSKLKSFKEGLFIDCTERNITHGENMVFQQTFKDCAGIAGMSPTDRTSEV